MTQSPKRPNPFTFIDGKLCIRGGDGDEGKEQGQAGGDGSGDGGEGAEPTPEQKRISELEQKQKDADQKAKDADKRAAAAEKALQDKEREGMEEHERTAAERDDFKDKYEKLLKFVETSVIDSAIMTLSSTKDKNGQPKYNWQDVEAVRAFIDKGAIKLDLDNYSVDGLDTQLSHIAKNRPYLLVPQQNDSGKGGDQGPPPGPATGAHPLGGSNRQRETDRTKLGSKYKLPGFVGANTTAGIAPAR